VNSTAQKVVELARQQFDVSGIDGIHTFSHPFGCSQLGDDHNMTRQTLINLVRHPNAGAVLVLGLGCENNGIAAFKEAMGDFNEDRVKFLISQQSEDEIEDALDIVEGLIETVSKDERSEASFSELKVGFKCGGSDGFSGISANPLVGYFSDWHVERSGTAVLTEVPEMFGAETLLMKRSIDREVFDKTVNMINSFKAYFRKMDQPIYENPSPGNKDGGITTLEDKSLGCIQKGGQAVIVDVLDYGERLEKPGLNLMNGPGNDMVSVTSLIAAGCHVVLFTTGRGTPFGGPVPTLKISSNTALAERKKNWIDFNAGSVMEGTSFEDARDGLIDLIKDVANGDKKSKNESRGYKEISIFKDGVTL
jgi:altronate hydrolase